MRSDPELQRCDLEIADAMREETLAGLLWEMDWRSERALIQRTMAADGAPDHSSH